MTSLRFPRASIEQSVSRRVVVGITPKTVAGCLAAMLEAIKMLGQPTKNDENVVCYYPRNRVSCQGEQASWLGARGRGWPQWLLVSPYPFSLESLQSLPSRA